MHQNFLFTFAIAIMVGSHIFAETTLSQVATPPTATARQDSKAAIPIAAVSGQDLGVLTGHIDSRKLYRTFLDGGREISQRQQNALSPQMIVQQVSKRQRTAMIPLPAVTGLGKLDYPAIAKSSLMFGNVYDCGRCSNLHANIAGGVVISSDGLALTNHHVLDRDMKGVVAVFAMTFDGRSHPVVEVLASNKELDVTLVRLGGAGPFFPAPIAERMPLPLEPATVLSHPSNQFYVLTQGVVSRHVSFTNRNQSEHWMEVTAEYGAGSSGSGVFNSRGEIIGLVSRISPLYRHGLPHAVVGGVLDEAHAEKADHKPDDSPAGSAASEAGKSFVEMTLRRCVTVDAIKSCFAK